MVGFISDHDLGNEEIEQRGLDAVYAARGEVTDAAFDDAWTRNPLPSITRWAGRTGYDAFSDEKRLEPDELNARYGIKDAAGNSLLKFDRAMTATSADELYRLRRAELYRQSIMDRGEGGFVEGAAKLGSAFAASALDPLAIAAGLVPVVGQARYGAMLAGAGSTAGRLGVRAGVGAASGAVGTALIEPIIAAVAYTESADYGLDDSLINVLFGAALGGGVHAGGGLIADALTGRYGSIQTRQAALQTAMSQLADGRPVDVEAVFRSDLLATSNAVDPAAMRAVDRDLIGFLEAERIRATLESAGVAAPVDQPALRGVQLAEQIDAIRATLTKEQADLDRLLAERERIAARGTAEQERLDKLAETTQQELIQARIKLNRANAALGRAEGRANVSDAAGEPDPKRAKQAAKARADVEAARANVAEVERRAEIAKQEAAGFKANTNARLADALAVQDRAIENARTKVTTTEASLNAATEAATKRVQAERDAIRAALLANREEAANALRRSIAASIRHAREIIPAEREAVAAVDQLVARGQSRPASSIDELKDDLAGLMARVQERARLGEIDDADRALLAEGDALMAAAEKRANAVQSIASCIAGRV